MSYATKVDMIALFASEELVGLTDRASPPAGAIVDAVLDRALADASAEIDTYLAARYSLPIVPVPAVLATIACDMARYRLYDNTPTDAVRKRYTDAVRFLRYVAAGKAAIGGEGAGLVAGGVQSAGDDRVFSRDTLTDY